MQLILRFLEVYLLEGSNGSQRIFGNTLQFDCPVQNRIQLFVNILFGAELRFNGNNNDYLVFGLTKEFLYEHPDIFDLHAEKFHNLAKENNMLFIQAHPFRNWMMVIEPKMVDGVEVFNGHFGHDSRNEIADMWAEKYNLIKTSGTDYHYITSPANGGIFTEEEITDMGQLVEILKSGNYELNKGL